MRRLLVGIAMATLVMARPELYKEKEDFQYSRSSSDDGTKSGYYDAQRGNMGGNFERAHNMDTLAQHQMGGLVRQVEGELGDGSKTRTGSVFSSANSRGAYGSGHYDLSNLAGRNFHEGVSYDNSQFATSSLSNRAHTAQSSSQNNARYSTGGRSLNSNYRGYEASNLQGTENLFNANQFEQGRQEGHSSQYHSQSGYEGQNLYQQRINTDQLNAQNIDANTHHHRLISTVPVKIIVRPGQSIAVPLATQTHSGSQIASYYDHNAANTDAEVLSTRINQQSVKPSNSDKHYEASYSYNKEWEKHDTKPAVIPLAIPTVSPIAKSELYDDYYQQHGSQYSGNRYEQNSNFNAASSQSQHQADFNGQHLSSASTNSNTYSQSAGNSKVNSQSANLIGSLSAKPKSYQSSYSYHKSWERQGDPYIIKPASNGVYEGKTSDRLTDASDSQTAYNYGSRKTQNQYSLNSNCMIECEPTHIRVARSYSDQDQLEQQSENFEDLGQQTQTQWDNLADLGQQTQDTWTQADNFGQQTPNNEKIEDLGQQTQNQWDNLADHREHTQDTRTLSDNFEQQSLNKEKLEDLGQQTQNQWVNLADLGQQTQDTWTQADNFGQQTVDKEKIEDLGQQTQNQWDNLADLGQQTQDTWTQADNFGQQTLNKENLEDLGQQTQEHAYSFGQQTLNKENIDLEQTQMYHGQQTQDNLSNQQSEQPKQLQDFGQQTEDKWHPNNTDVFDQSQVSTENSHFLWDKQSEIEQASYNHQSVQHLFQQHHQDNLSHVNREAQENYNAFHSNPEQSQSENSGSLSGLWGKLDNLDNDNTEYGRTNYNSFFPQNSQNFNHNWQQKEKYDHSLGDKNQNNKVFITVDQKQEITTDKLSTISYNQPMEGVAFTTPKADAEKNFENHKEKFTTTTNKPHNTNIIRPNDVGRGDIGPEESLIESISNEPSSTDKSNDKEEMLQNNKNDTQKVNSNLEQIFVSAGEDSSDKSKIETTTPSIHNVHVIQEITSESIWPQELETMNDFVQNKNFAQENQHFIDEMKDIESQNSYRENTDEFSQQKQKSDQEINWNVESQNVEQQFVDHFSEQSQATVQHVDEEFENFGQHYDATGFQSQQIKDTNPGDFIPEDLNEGEVKEKEAQVDKEPSFEISNKPHVSNKHQVSSIPEEKEINLNQNKEAETSAVTEKPGFWKSLGSKLSNAKTKVASWFGS